MMEAPHYTIRMARPQALEHHLTTNVWKPPPALAERLGFLLKHAYTEYQSIQGAALAPLKLDGRLLAVLTLVSAEGPALQQRLSERLGIDRTTMVALIDALEHKGLVARRRDPEDRRGYRIGVTAAGTKTLARAQNLIDLVEHDLLVGLSGTERQQFRRLLSKLVRTACHERADTAKHPPT